jgi:hypothetical protein
MPRRLAVLGVIAALALPVFDLFMIEIMINKMYYIQYETINLPGPDLPGNSHAGRSRDPFPGAGSAVRPDGSPEQEGRLHRK